MKNINHSFIYRRMMELRGIFLLLLLYGLLPSLYAQSLEVKGTVVDENGEPLIGVTISEKKNPTNGTITDLDGGFTLNVSTMNGTLQFSYVGYKTLEEKIKSFMEVQMSSDSQTLDEVVVVAYGTQSRVSVTGAITSVNAEQLKQSPSSNIVSSMTGRLPGFITIQNSGRPGDENIEMYLRGVSTVNGQSPLILVDGVPREELSSLDPNEIQDISILKDASSTAVFGVRGANGVILVTTKRGGDEKPKVSLTAEYSIQDFAYEFNPLPAWLQATLKNQATINDYGEGAKLPYAEERILMYKDGTNPDFFPSNNNYWDLFMKSWAPQNRYNVNISGGNDRIKYFVNAGYLHQDGMFNTSSEKELGYDPQFKLDRYNFRTNLDLNVSKYIKASLNLAGYINKSNGSYMGGKNINNIMVGALGVQMGPGYLTLDGYGVPAGEPTMETYANLNNSGYTMDDKASLNSSFKLDFDLGFITPGLSTNVMASFDAYSVSSTIGSKGYNLYNAQVVESEDADGNIIYSMDYTMDKPYQIYTIGLKKNSTFRYSINLQWMLNYYRQFGKHRISGMFLAQRDLNEKASGSSVMLLPYNMLGVSGRVNYNYDDKYILEFNAGYNGSEQFSPEKRFGFFPAASIGWEVSNEEFMKRQDVITRLKLRASYGLVGSDKLGDSRFLYMDNVQVQNGGYSGSLGEGKKVNYVLIGNPDISWETAYKQNYGLELELIKDITLKADYFIENRRDMLISRNTIPTMQGMPIALLPKTNFGEVLNKGMELELGYRKSINNDWSIMTNLNLSLNKNTIIEYDEAPYSEDYAYRYRNEGYSIGQQWGYLIDWDSKGKGYFTSQEEIDSYYPYTEGAKPRPGDFVYKDVNGDGEINSKDISPVGYGWVPRVTYGGSLRLSYKNFDFSVLVQGVSKTSSYYNGYGVTEDKGTFWPIHENAWTKERYESGLPISYPALSTTISSSMTQNDFFIMDRSYVRIKNMEVGWTVPKQWLKKVGISKARIYVNGQNLFTWDKLPFDHYDPEQKTVLTIPILRLYNIGLNVTF